MPAVNRRAFLKAAPAAAAPFLARGATKRNVLVIATDDLNNRVGCYGHPLVKTPAIDSIATGGVRFDRAYCQYPLCSPSRTSILTGLAPDATGVYDLQKHFRSSVPDVVTLGQLFQKNGYYSARVGKLYHYGNPGTIGTDGLDDRPTWNEVVNPNGIDHREEEPKLTNYTPKTRLGSAMAYYASPADDEEHTDGMVASETIRLLERHKGEPFFIGAGFYKPHCPWIAPTKYFDMYPLSKVELVPFQSGEMEIAPRWAYNTRPANYGLSDEQLRECIRAYYATISFADTQIGRILTALKRLKLADNTTIVFWSDHGYQLGEHGQWMKQTLWEPSARVPFLIGGAGVDARGRGSRRCVELLDLYPTLADMCNLQGTPANLHGASLTPLLRNPAAPWSRPAITQVRRAPKGEVPTTGYSLRNERYRYNMWNGGERGEEFYDYQADPREMRNLASDSQHAALKRTLKMELESVLSRRQATPAA